MTTFLAALAGIALTVALLAGISWLIDRWTP